MNSEPQSITLYYRDNNHDKIYQASIDPQDGGFIVRFAFGRRGSTLQTGCKTPVPVDYATAKKTFDKLVKEKTAKGYTPGADGTPYQQTDNQDRSTGVLPQMLNPIDEAEATALLKDPAWAAQEKLDCRRVLIRRSNEQIIGINRSGLIIDLPQPIVAAALNLGSHQWILDGEAIGDTFHAFDLLEQACVDLRPEAYHKRLRFMYRMLPADGPVRAVPTATTAARKRAMLADLRQRDREGIVFKRLDAAYAPGRPASGGDQRKLKFTATCSCIVAGPNGSKRSVGLQLLDGGKPLNVGNVTIPARQPIPTAGQVVEVRFLYAFRGGSLYQPVFLGIREDVPSSDCRVDQLKFKAADGDEDSPELNQQTRAA